MFPTNVALVPYEPGSQVKLDELADVAAALQVQLVRDFAPIWGVSGTVSAFPSLEAMPPGYLPMVVINKDIPVQAEGFHFTVAGVAFALVRYSDDRGWSLAASHELLEMVLDPSGTLTTAGRSLEDGTSWVDYLVEACDPCERSTYDINGVTVSDFVTPHYYSTTTRPGTRYSFMGRISEPLQILGRGYLTWRTRLPENELWQAFGGPPEPDDDGSSPATGTETKPSLDSNKPVGMSELTIRKVPRAPSKMTRASVSVRKARPGASHTSTGGPHSKPASPATDFGGTLRKDIGKFLDYAHQWETTRPPNIDEIITVVKAAGEGKTPPANYKTVLEYLERQKQVADIFGPDLMDPGIGLWICMHIL